MESRALSLAYEAFLAWPESTRLRLQGLEQLSPHRLFFIFYALNQCEKNSPAMEHAIAERRRRGEAVEVVKAGWMNRVVSANTDFSKAFGCRKPEPVANPFRDCNT